MNKHGFLSLSFLVALCVAVSGCNHIRLEKDENGMRSFRAVNALRSEKNYDLGSFNRVRIAASLKVFITQSDSFSVKAKGKKNQFDNLRLSNKDGVLTIASKEALTFWGEGDLPDLYVSLPVLEKLDISGASKISGQNKFKQATAFTIENSGASEIKMDLEVPQVYISNSGAGSLHLKGLTQKLEIHSSGAAEVESNALQADSVLVALSGAGDVRVHALRHLEVSASGVGTIKYTGTPTVVKSASGLVSIEKED